MEKVNIKNFIREEIYKNFGDSDKTLGYLKDLYILSHFF